MKKIFFAFALLMLSVVAAMSQELKKTSTITEQEVPVAVRNAFDKEFGKVPAEGKWSVTFSLRNEGARTVASPLWYTYFKKDKKEKIEVRYTPEGKLESSKGITKLEATAGTEAVKGDS
jgi:hypothetical protein